MLKLASSVYFLPVKRNTVEAPLSNIHQDLAARAARLSEPLTAKLITVGLQHR